MMAGDWRWAREGALSVARFTLPNGTERISLTCDPARKTVTLRQPSYATGEQPVTITTTSSRRVVTGKGSGAAPYAIAVTFAASDPLLDAIAFSRGRFMIEHGADWSIAPTWPEISRVIEDCR